MSVAALVAAPLVAVPAPPAAATHGPAAWTIDTAAGNGTKVVSGDGGPATAAGLGDLIGDIAADAAGNLYVSGSGRVRRVDSAGTITTVAGTGVVGFSGDGGPATAAKISGGSLATDAAGNLYIGEDGRIRKVDSAGIITTIAGTGVSGFSGDGGPATAAMIGGGGMDVDAAGNVYFADPTSVRVRKVSAAGIITTVAGNGQRGSKGDGRAATSAQMNWPQDVAVDAAGNLYIADIFNNKVRKVSTSGIISTFAGTGARGFAGDGGPATAADLNSVLSVETQGANVFLTDSGEPESSTHVVRRVDAAGIIDTVAGRPFMPGFAGDGGPSTAASMNPWQLALGSNGHLYVAGLRRVRVIETSHVWAAPSPRSPSVGQAFNYVVGVSGLPAAAGGVGLSATLPPEVAFSSVTTSQGSCSGGATVTCSLGTVAAGATATVRITVNALAVGVAPLAVTASADDPATLPGLATFTATTKVSGAGCERVVTSSLVLTSDIGPCAGNGLIIRAGSVDVDLNGHTVSGWDGPGDGNSGGIRVARVSRVTVHGGTVRGFDAGVVVNGGRANTVRDMEVLDNVGPADDPRNVPLGDGIVVFASVGAKILDNHVAGNGVIDGIGIWFPGADNNTVQRNLVENTVGQSLSVPDADLGHGIAVSGSDGSGLLATGNQVLDNTVRNNAGAGISSVNHAKGTIARNIVEGNGFGPAAPRLRLPAIGVRTGGGPALRTTDMHMTIEANEVHGNSATGIEIRATANTIIGNDASGNALTAAPVNDPYFDLQDRTAGCTNTWSGNIWGSGGFSPACTATGGSGPAAAAASTPTSAAQTASQREQTEARAAPTRRWPRESAGTPGEEQ